MERMSDGRFLRLPYKHAVALLTSHELAVTIFQVINRSLAIITWTYYIVNQGFVLMGFELLQLRMMGLYRTFNSTSFC